MPRQLYEIWLSDSELESPAAQQWCLQMHNYVAHFKTEAQAQRYVAAVKTERKRQGLK